MNLENIRELRTVHGEAAFKEVKHRVARKSPISRQFGALAGAFSWG
jgi:hypothetical protein